MKTITINQEAKEFILEYLQNWIDELGKYPFSYRKGIVRAIYNKVDAIPVTQEKVLVMKIKRKQGYENYRTCKCGNPRLCSIHKFCFRCGTELRWEEK